VGSGRSNITGSFKRYTTRRGESWHPAANGEASRIVLFWVDDVGEHSSEKQVHAAARPVAKNLVEFLRKFADGMLNQGYD